MTTTAGMIISNGRPWAEGELVETERKPFFSEGTATKGAPLAPWAAVLNTDSLALEIVEFTGVTRRLAIVLESVIKELAIKLKVDALVLVTFQLVPFWNDAMVKSEGS